MTTSHPHFFDIRLCLALVLLAAFASPANAQVPVLTGTVTERGSSAPLAGAAITLFNGHTLVVHADSRGVYSISQQQWPFAGPVTVRVLARGHFAVTSLANIGASPALTLNQDLRPGGILLQGVVLDAHTQQPVAHALLCYTGPE